MSKSKKNKKSKRQSKEQLTAKDLARLNSRKGLRELLASKKINIEKALNYLKYEEELELLQMELIKLQTWVKQERKKVAILFEGRDASGKGGTIFRFSRHLSPRSMRIVALPKPSETEKGQWYFQRYVNRLPNPGEIVFFDRSWYNRAVVEPAMGFCSKEEYQTFMNQVTEFEHMISDSNIILFKFWFAISKDEQERRFEERKVNPLKQWKLSPVDEQAQKMWDIFTEYKNRMLNQTHTTFSPWIVVEANDKKRARLESMRYVLSKVDYEGKQDAKVSLLYDPAIIVPYHRAYEQLDL